MKTVLLVFGTRPEVIKMLPVILKLKKHNDRIRLICCATGQHKSLVEQILSSFHISVDCDLEIMKKDQTLTHITAECITRLEMVYKEYNPDIVMVQGDTSSAFAAGLAAYYAKIPVWHIEAGLRTYDPFQPYPEEINRRMLSVLSDFHFAPTELSRQNLLNEGIPESKIQITGNTVIDMLYIVLKMSAVDIRKFAGLSNRNSKIILVTAHRRENIGKPLENIYKAIKHIAELFNDTDILFPVHPNPNVREKAYQYLSGMPNIFMVDPLDYFTFVYAMKESYIILTDSGGVQEEAPSLGKPVLVLRNKTERPEAVNAGTVKIVGDDCKTIVNSVSRLLTDKNEYNKMANAVNPYGDGKASGRIVKKILENLK